MNDPLSRIPLFSAGPQAHAVQALQQADGLFRNGKYAEAAILYRQALALRPGWGEALLGLGNAVYGEQKLGEAAQAYLQAVHALPGRVEAVVNLATTYYAMEYVSEARAWYTRALQLQPHAGIELRLATLVNPIPASAQEIIDARRGAAEALERVLQKKPVIADPYRQYGNTPFYFSYHGLNNRAFHAQLANTYLQACPSLGFAAPHCARYMPPKGRKLKMIAVSAYYFDHTVTRLVRGMLEHWPRDNFEIVLGILNRRTDGETEALARCAAKTVHLPHDLAHAQRLLAQEQADIVFYPEIGMDLMTYLLGFTRLAPVQCVGWGHPDTTGIPNVDYYISTALAEPEDAASHYTEKLIQLQGLPVYYPRPEAPPAKSRKALGLPEGRIYICPQSIFKLHPEFDEVLQEILQRDEAAQIVLMQGMHPHWTELMKRRLADSVGANMNRVHFAPARPRADYLAMLAASDVMLDPLHFGGGNSTFEALSLGVPVITWPGELMRGRVTLACYRAMKVADYVVQDRAHYAARAVEVAKKATPADRIRLSAASLVLFNNPAGVDELSHFLHSAVEKAAKGANT